jgi:NADH-quinone oxidoreductase subunit G
LANRGEYAEIMTFVGRTVDSELSGNMIDLCPVGALTSKPFRYTARTWELARRKSISPHDGLGSNLVVQVKNDRVMRVVPRENEAINECWLSDKERFSYEGLNSPERLTRPMIRRDGALVETDWQTALEHVVAGLGRVRDQHGGAAIGTLASPHSTLEELYLAQKLTRGLESGNIDFRLRQSDFSDDARRRDGSGGVPWLGMSIAEFAALDRVLVIGSFLRKDHPLLAQRLRQSVKKGAQVSVLHSAGESLLITLANERTVAPAMLPAALAEIVVAAGLAAGTALHPALADVDPGDIAKSIAASLGSGERKGIFLGNFAQQHPQATQLHALAQSLAELTGAKIGFLTEAANSVGGYLAGAFPADGGLNAQAMLGTAERTPCKAFILLHAEPELDSADPAAAHAALSAAEFVVALSPFRPTTADDIDVALPVSPFTETGGTFVNCEGRSQRFGGVALALGETRPAWKVLRVLGSMLELPGFAYEDIEAVRSELVPAAEVASRLSNATDVAIERPRSPAPGVERVTDVPVYFADPLVRRARSLQQTKDAKSPVARANAATLSRLGLADGAAARVRQGTGEAMLKVSLDNGVPDGCVRIAAAHSSTRTLGPMFGPVTVEPV